MTSGDQSNAIRELYAEHVRLSWQLFNLDSQHLSAPFRGLWRRWNEISFQEVVQTADARWAAKATQSFERFIGRLSEDLTDVTAVANLPELGPALEDELSNRRQALSGSQVVEVELARRQLYEIERSIIREEFAAFQHFVGSESGLTPGEFSAGAFREMSEDPLFDGEGHEEGLFDPDDFQDETGGADAADVLIARHLGDLSRHDLSNDAVRVVGLLSLGQALSAPEQTRMGDWNTPNDTLTSEILGEVVTQLVVTVEDRELGHLLHDRAALIDKVAVRKMAALTLDPDTDATVRALVSSHFSGDIKAFKQATKRLDQLLESNDHSAAAQLLALADEAYTQRHGFDSTTSSDLIPLLRSAIEIKDVQTAFDFDDGRIEPGELLAANFNFNELPPEVTAAIPSTALASQRATSDPEFDANALEAVIEINATRVLQYLEIKSSSGTAGPLVRQTAAIWRDQIAHLIDTHSLTDEASLRAFMVANLGSKQAPLARRALAKTIAAIAEEFNYSSTLVETVRHQIERSRPRLANRQATFDRFNPLAVKPLRWNELASIPAWLQGLSLESPTSSIADLSSLTQQLGAAANSLEFRGEIRSSDLSTVSALVRLGGAAPSASSIADTYDQFFELLKTQIPQRVSDIDYETFDLTTLTPRQLLAVVDMRQASGTPDQAISATHKAAIRLALKDNNDGIPNDFRNSEIIRTGIERITQTAPGDVLALDLIHAWEDFTSSLGFTNASVAVGPVQLNQTTPPNVTLAVPDRSSSVRSIEGRSLQDRLLQLIAIEAGATTIETVGTLPEFFLSNSEIRRRFSQELPFATDTEINSLVKLQRMRIDRVLDAANGKAIRSYVTSAPSAEHLAQARRIEAEHPNVELIEAPRPRFDTNEIQVSYIATTGDGQRNKLTVAATDKNTDHTYQRIDPAPRRSSGINPNGPDDGPTPEGPGTVGPSPLPKPVGPGGPSGGAPTPETTLPVIAPSTNPSHTPDAGAQTTTQPKSPQNTVTGSQDAQQQFVVSVPTTSLSDGTTRVGAANPKSVTTPTLTNNAYPDVAPTHSPSPARSEGSLTPRSAHVLPGTGRTRERNTAHSPASPRLAPVKPKPVRTEHTAAPPKTAPATTRPAPSATPGAPASSTPRPSISTPTPRPAHNNTVLPSRPSPVTPQTATPKPPSPRDVAPKPPSPQTATPQPPSPGPETPFRRRQEASGPRIETAHEPLEGPATAAVRKEADTAAVQSASGAEAEQVQQPAQRVRTSPTLFIN